MNESDFENALRKLSPAAPPARLEQAIARELTKATLSLAPRVHQLSGKIIRTKERPLSRLFFGLCWATGGAAVALIAAFGLGLLHTPQTTPVAQPTLVAKAENIFEATESSRELLETEDSGLIYTEEQEPNRVVRYNSMERYVWANPATGAQVEVEVPREDVVLVPVSFQ